MSRGLSRLVAIAAAFVLLGGSVVAASPAFAAFEAHSIEIGELVYLIDEVDGEVIAQLSGLSENAEQHYETWDLVVPDTIPDGSQLYPVVGVTSNAFSENSEIRSVTFGANVTTISGEAFYGNTALTSVKFGQSVTIIGDAAFLGTSITKVRLPSSISSLGAQAFGPDGVKGALMTSVIMDAPNPSSVSIVAGGNGSFGPADDVTIYYPFGSSSWQTGLWNGYATAEGKAPPATATLGAVQFDSAGDFVSYSHEEQTIDAATLVTVDSSRVAGDWSISLQATEFVWSPSALSTAVSADSIPAARLTASLDPASVTGANRESLDFGAANSTLDEPWIVLSGGSGAGTYEFDLDLSLTIPATTRAGLYTGTLLMTMVVAP